METVIEETTDLDGNMVQTVRLEDGREVRRVFSHTCAICGAKSDRPFPSWAISCFRKECKHGIVGPTTMSDKKDTAAIRKLKDEP
jgi:hypothetical protein